MTSHGIQGKFLDFILPPRCPVCGGHAVRVTALCGECWASLKTNMPPLCSYCGNEVQAGASQICTECYDNPRAWDYGTSAIRYAGVGRTMVLRLKHMRSENMAPIMAKICVEECPEIFERADLLVPIPLHWTRALKRGFNQAALLAFHLGLMSNTQMSVQILKRKRATKKQTGFKDFEGRMQNLENAFALSDAEVLRGRNVLLIDDVMTSGSSFEHAARVLKMAEPQSVGVFAFARAGENDFKATGGAWNFESHGLR